MIDRQGGKVLIECDSCDEVCEGEPDEEFSAERYRSVTAPA